MQYCCSVRFFSHFSVRIFSTVKYEQNASRIVLDTSFHFIWFRMMRCAGGDRWSAALAKLGDPPVHGATLQHDGILLQRHAPTALHCTVLYYTSVQFRFISFPHFISSDFSLPFPLVVYSHSSNAIVLCVRVAGRAYLSRQSAVVQGLVDELKRSAQQQQQLKATSPTAAAAAQTPSIDPVDALTREHILAALQKLSLRCVSTRLPLVPTTQ